MGGPENLKGGSVRPSVHPSVRPSVRPIHFSSANQIRVFLFSANRESRPSRGGAIWLVLRTSQPHNSRPVNSPGVSVGFKARDSSLENSDPLAPVHNSFLLSLRLPAQFIFAFPPPPCTIYFCSPPLPRPLSQFIFAFPPPPTQFIFDFPPRPRSQFNFAFSLPSYTIYFCFPPLPPLTI